MKRMISAVVLLIIVFSAYIFSFLYIKNTCKTANKYLTACVEVYKKDQDATDEAQKLEKYWSKQEKSLSFFVNHGTIDDIELAISSLKSYSKTRDNEIFYEYSGTVKTLIHQLMEDTAPNIHSIF